MPWLKVCHTFTLGDTRRRWCVSVPNWPTWYWYYRKGDPPPFADMLSPELSRELTTLSTITSLVDELSTDSAKHVEMGLQHAVADLQQKLPDGLSVHITDT